MILLVLFRAHVTDRRLEISKLSFCVFSVVVIHRAAKGLIARFRSASTFHYFQVVCPHAGRGVLKELITCFRKPTTLQ